MDIGRGMERNDYGFASGLMQISCYKPIWSVDFGHWLLKSMWATCLFHTTYFWHLKGFYMENKPGMWRCICECCQIYCLSGSLLQEECKGDVHILYVMLCLWTLTWDHGFLGWMIWGDLWQFPIKYYHCGVFCECCQLYCLSVSILQEERQRWCTSFVYNAVLMDLDLGS